jgi:hypothetical protein
MAVIRMPQHTLRTLFAVLADDPQQTAHAIL